MKKILIAGGTGLIGKEIIKQLENEDVIIHVLSRSKHQDKGKLKFFQWDLDKQWIEEGAMQVDHIINLTGAGVADKRWTDERKKILIESRTQAADLLSKSIGLEQKIESYVSASAIGYYGDSGDKLMLETDLPIQEGFLSHCCVLWEEAAMKLRDKVQRLSIIRVGIVLDKKDGAFAKMLIPFKFRMASYFADGDMMFSWIHVEDIAKVFISATLDSNYAGIYNAVAPIPLTNKELTIKIKEKKKGFYLLNSVPTIALRTAMGEMADVVLTSNKVSSAKLEGNGFEYNFRTIEEALNDLLE